MVTYLQYIRKARKKKIFNSSTPKFDGAPFRYGICSRVGTVKPKKPNSAQRKIAKVDLKNGRQLIAYIPGFGHRLLKSSEVMIRGGRVPDLPGCRYHIIRGKKDLLTPEARRRVHRRSKYATKKPKLTTEPGRRKEGKDAKREYIKAGFIGFYESDEWKDFCLDTSTKLKTNFKLD